MPVAVRSRGRPGDTAFGGPAAYVFWHEYLPLPIYLRPYCRLTMLTSRDQDARCWHTRPLPGMQVIRGRPRGGMVAVRQLINRADRAAWRSPRMAAGTEARLTQGCAYVSSRLQIPIVLVGFGYDRPWRLQRAWDKFALPKPFSRARVILGPRIQVPPKLDREALEQHRQWLESQLLQLTQLTEDWAEGRCTLPGDEPLYRHGRGEINSGPPIPPPAPFRQGSSPADQAETDAASVEETSPRSTQARSCLTAHTTASAEHGKS